MEEGEVRIIIWFSRTIMYASLIAEGSFLVSASWMSSFGYPIVLPSFPTTASWSSPLRRSVGPRSRSSSCGSLVTSTPVSKNSSFGGCRYSGRFFLNHVCFRISLMVIRWIGFTMSILDIRSLASGERYDGIEYFPSVLR